MIFRAGGGATFLMPGAQVMQGGGPRQLAALHSSLVSYWKMDEASGTRADSVGSNTLTDNNTVTSATGLVYPLAADFEDANNESLSIASNASLQMGDIDMWVAAWVKFESLTFYDLIVGKDTGGEEYSLRYLINTPRWEWLVTNAGNVLTTYTVTQTPTLGAWYFVLAYHDATNDVLGLSINGAAAMTTAHTGGVKVATNALAIGGGSSVYLDGLIGPVMIGKNYVPTGANITALYNGGAGLTLAADGGNLMATLATVRTRVDNWLSGIWPTVQARQEAYFQNHQKYWQGLITNADAPNHTTGGFADAIPDKLTTRPTDQASSWTDAFPELSGVAIPAAFKMDAYDSPQGAGYVATVYAALNGIVYSRSQNVGPETWRTQGWTQVDVSGRHSAHVPIRGSYALANLVRGRVAVRGAAAVGVSVSNQKGYRMKALAICKEVQSGEAKGAPALTALVGGWVFVGDLPGAYSAYVITGTPAELWAHKDDPAYLAGVIVSEPESGAKWAELGAPVPAPVLAAVNAARVAAGYTPLAAGTTWTGWLRVALPHFAPGAYDVFDAEIV